MLGLNTKFWFGVVEDRFDPLDLGRLRVRVFSEHTADKGQLPTSDLKWATPIQSITSAAVDDIGESPTGIVEGSWVVGFFMDGEEAQVPMVLGTIAGIPTTLSSEVNTRKVGFHDPNQKYPSRKYEQDVDRRARGINNITKTPDPVTGEPADPFAAKYPYNQTRRTESGHLMEFDDTPDAERIHIYHRSGTFIEMHPNGDVVTHHANGYRTVAGNDNLHVAGSVTVVVDGSASISVSESASISAKDITTTSETLTFNADDMKVNVKSLEINKTE